MKKILLILFILLSLVSACRVFAEMPVIAVSDFQNLTGDTAYDWLAVSFGESLNAHIVRAGGLRVVERTRFLKTFTEIRTRLPGIAYSKSFIETGRLVGTGYIVTGSVSLSGGKFLVNARLTDTGTGKVLKTNNAEGEIKDIFRMQRELAGGVLKYFGREIRNNEKGFTEEKPVSSEEEFAKGLIACQIKLDGSEAVNCFQKAIDGYGDFAEAYLGMGDSYEYLKDYTNAINKYNNALELFYKNIDDDGISRAYYKIGEASYFMEDYPGAVNNFGLSIKYGRLYEDVIYSRIADIYRKINVMEKAIEFQKKANVIFRKFNDYYSYSEGVSELVKMYAGQKKYPKALKELKKAERMLRNKNHLYLNKIVELRLEIEKAAAK